MGVLHPWRDWRRKGIGERAFPGAWSRIIERNVGWCRGLDSAERGHLEDLIQVFVAEKRFEGCGGLAITDEIRVTVAAQACLLLLNLQHDYYERLASILVYPEGFAFQKEERDAAGAGTVTLTDLPVVGLSSSAGAVVLSWPDTVQGGRRPDDGVNVVFHEFAHQLDQLDGAMDGAPRLAKGAMYRDWARVLGEAYRGLQEAVAEARPTLISAYGATKPAEFFAVVTELFFERPADLRREHPALYEEFRLYFRQDPAARENGGA